MSVIVTRGPAVEIAAADDDRPTRFCFACRRHTPHRWAMHDYDYPSYYEPSVAIRCTGCGRSAIHFPGCEPDGPDYPSEAVWDALIADPRRAPHRERLMEMLRDEVATSRASGDRPQ